MAKARDAGVTLIEVMVVVAIVALLAAVAVPALSRDDSAQQIARYSSQFARDVQRARAEAISSREDRALLIEGTNYRYGIPIPPAGTSISELARRQAPVKVVVTDVQAIESTPWNTGYNPGGVATATLSTTRRIRFLATGGIQIDVPGPGYVESPASVFFRSTNGEYTARVTIFRTTGFFKLYDKWAK
jgi:prepilin-type N-terminal cleavage/methylation domain-containing protein